MLHMNLRGSYFLVNTESVLHFYTLMIYLIIIFFDTNLSDGDG